MLFTLYYMASTWVQSSRLNAMKNSIVQALKKQATLVLYKGTNFTDIEGIKGVESSQIRGITSEYCDNKRDAHLLDLISYKNQKQICSIVPMQTLTIDNWIRVPNEHSFFPFVIRKVNDAVLDDSSKFHLILEANFILTPVFSSFGYLNCKLEEFGIPVAWTADEYFALVLETDVEHFSKLSNTFLFHDITIDNVLEIIRLQVVKVNGSPCSIENEQSIPVFSKALEVIDNDGKDTKMCFYRQKHAETIRKVAKTAINVVKDKKNNTVSQYRSVHIKSEKNEERDLKILVNGVCKNDDKSQTQDDKLANCSKTMESGNNHIEETINDDSFAFDYPSIDIPTFGESAEDDEVDNVINWRVGSSNSLLSADPDVVLSEHSRKSTPVHHSGEQKTGKPPNVIIYSESPSTLQNIKTSLNATLRQHRYTVYSLSLKEMLTSPWTDQASLVVVCGNVPNNLKPLLTSYLLNTGGRLLCICSDLLELFLPSFKTMEIRPNEIVTLDYGKWKHVSFLHHIFCYQPSAKSGKFSLDESPSGNACITNTPSSVDVIDADGKTHTLNVKVLAAEETWQTPSLLLATDVEGSGTAVFSQIHLELDPDEDKTKKETSNKRLEVLAHILSKHLELDCNLNTKGTSISYTPAYFLGRHEQKLEFLEKLSLNAEKVLKMKNITLQFYGKGMKPPKATEHFLPVLLYDCPANFSTVEYFENLESKEIGRLVIYSETMTSSMEILNGTILKHGFVAIPRQQTTGVGRGGNAWLSPEGCAMFSVQLHIPLSSCLGARLSLLQHIIALSVVSSICSIPGYEDLDLGLKWPNDIYAGGNAKIGGLVISSSINNNVAVCNIGCGVNLNNKLPTTCINQMIKDIKLETGKRLSEISFEKYLALVFSEMEKLLTQVQDGNVEIVFDLYYKYWLHSFAQVRVVNPNGGSQSVTIIGLDDYGFLKVRSENGDTFTVQPDGNTFNMLSGLIAPK